MYLRMTIGRNNRNIQCSTRTFIRLFKRQRSPREKHGLDHISHIHPRPDTFSAHSTPENLAPVVLNRLNHTLKGSEHAVILSANCGTSSCFNSSLVRVHNNAATTPPADVPVMMRGSKSASKNALITPKLIGGVNCSDLNWPRDSLVVAK